MTAFEPQWPLRHAQVQSALASLKLRNWPRRGHAMARHAQQHILDCGDGIRLMGLHSPQPAKVTPRGLVILIHGWEGSHESVYLFSTACTLYDAGYNVFRLNLRDHGGTHALNQELFHSARIDEVLGAIRAIGRIDPTRPHRHGRSSWSASRSAATSRCASACTARRATSRRSSRSASAPPSTRARLCRRSTKDRACSTRIS
jgi:predicted alpha/beta-fold hydrolase